MYTSRKRPTRARAYPLLLICICLLGCARPLRPVREQRAAANSDDIVYVALGDSTGLGLGARGGEGYAGRLLQKLRQSHPRARLVNLCSVGATTADVLDKQITRLPEARPALFTLGVGINDLLRGASEEQFANNYEQIISRLHDAGGSLVIINLPDLTAAPGLSRFQQPDVLLRLASFNKRIEETAKRYSVPLFDLHRISDTAMRSHPEFFSADGFHPSDAGYQFWAEALWPTVKRAIARPSTTETGPP